MLNPFMTKLMYFYTYVLLSGSDGKFYTGYNSEDLKGRFEDHRRGNVDSTKARRPLEFVYYEACRDRKDARHREQYLKTHHGKMILRNRLKSYLTGCQIL